MSIVVAWSMVATIAFSTAVFQAFLWFLDRTNKAPIFGALMSFSGSVLALTEMGVAKTSDPTTAQALLFWTNVAVFTLLVALVWFVHIYLRNDWSWLLYAITGLLAVCLMANLVLPGNVTFSSISVMQPKTSAWGEVWYQPLGEANPVRFLSEIAVLMIIVYIAGAMTRAYRAGDRRKAVIVGGASLFFIIAGGSTAILVDNNIMQTPYVISWTFVAIGLALGIELVIQAAKSAALGLQMEKGERRWLTLLENVELGVISVSGDGAVTYVNRFFEDMLGYEPGKLDSENIIDLIPGGLRKEFMERFEAARRAGPRARAEFPLVSTNGEIKQVRWSFVGLQDVGGEFDTYLAICDDLTALKRAEAGLRSSERTIERYDRASFLLEISSSLAHELNQPLAAILSNAQAGKRMLERDPVPVEELDEIFVDIVQDDARAGQVIQSMRRLLKSSAMEQVATELEGLVSEVQEILNGELMQSAIGLNIEIPDDIPKISVGRIEIQQVLVNLLGNAIRVLHSSETENPAIKVSAQQTGDMVAVSVSDNGPGIDEQTRLRIFEPFFTTREHGMGMGLSISMRIVELHGGKLECESEPDQGATFKFAVPIAQTKQELQIAGELADHMHS